MPTKLRVLHGLPIATIVEDHHVSTAHDVRGAGLSALPACDDHHSVRQNPRSGITCLTRFETAIAAARSFLGLYHRELLWQKPWTPSTTSLPLEMSAEVSLHRGGPIKSAFSTTVNRENAAQQERMAVQDAASARACCFDVLCSLSSPTAPGAGSEP